MPRPPHNLRGRPAELSGEGEGRVTAVVKVEFGKAGALSSGAPRPLDVMRSQRPPIRAG